MTTTEFSQTFDTLIAAYNDSNLKESDIMLAFDEYEKSVFLTKAQDDIIISFYTGNNSYNEGFENTEELRRYLSSLIYTDELEEVQDSTVKKVTNKSHIYKLNNDVWFITYEAIKVTSEDPCLNGLFVEVIPTTQDDIHRVLKNPFKGPSERRALRLDLADNSVEIISSLEGKYIVRYLKEPEPIIVDTLNESLDIRGKHEITECKLHKALHRVILDQAVKLAIQSKLAVLPKK